MKVISFETNRYDHTKKIELIKKYAHYDKFWFDLDDNRKYIHQDYLDFVATIYPKAYNRLNGHQNVKRHLLYFHVFFKLPLHLKGKHITPRKILKSVSKSLINVFQNKKCSSVMIDVSNIIYDSYFTPKRISEFKKLKVIKQY